MKYIIIEFTNTETKIKGSELKGCKGLSKASPTTTHLHVGPGGERPWLVAQTGQNEEKGDAEWALKVLVLFHLANT